MFAIAFVELIDLAMLGVSAVVLACGGVVEIIVVIVHSVVSAILPAVEPVNIASLPFAFELIQAAPQSTCS